MAITAAQLDIQFRTQGADRVKGDLNDVGNAVDRTGERSRIMGGAFLGLGTGIVGAFTAGTMASIDFNEQMANVNSIAQLTTAELTALGDEVLRISTETGQSATTLASGLYDIQSSGFAGAEALQLLEVSADGANAGLTTTDVSARALTAVLNGYNLSVEDSAHIMDVMFQTVNDGVITFEQLANNLGNTIPMASALGVSFEELAAGYAQMTLSGVPAAQVETQLAALMRAALNPTTELTAAVQDYGYANVESLIAAEGMVGFLQVLTDASGGSSEALFSLLGTQEAVNAALLLGGENLDAYNAEVERMAASSEGLGATQTALAKQMESTAFSLRLLKTNIQAAIIALGVQLEPAIRFVAKGMTSLLKGFLALPKPVQRVIGAITGIVGILAVAAGAWVLFGSTIAAIGGILLGLLAPLALIAAAVGALYLAWETNFLGIQDVVDDFIFDLETLTNAFRYFMDNGMDPVEAGLEALTVAFPAISGVVDPLIDMVNHLTGAFSAFQAGRFDIMFGSLRAALSDIGDLAVGLFDWTLEVGVPAIAAFSWDIAGLILDAIGSVLVYLTDLIVQLDGAEVVAGTIDLAASITTWIKENPIPAILIGAGVLSLAFFGVPGVVTVALVGLAGLIALAIADDMPDEIVPKLVALSVKFTEFAIELQGFVGEIRDEIAKRYTEATAEPFKIGFIRLDFSDPSSWISDSLGATAENIQQIISAYFKLYQFTAPAIDIDWSGMFVGVMSGLQSASDGLGRELQRASDGLGRALDGFSDTVAGLLQDSADHIAEDPWSLRIPAPSLENAGFLQDISEGLGMKLQSLSNGVAILLQDTADRISGSSWNFTIPTPDIDWPDMPTPPQWLIDLVTMNPIDYIRKYFGGGGGSTGTLARTIEFTKDLFGEGTTGQPFDTGYAGDDGPIGQPVVPGPDISQVPGSQNLMDTGPQIEHMTQIYYAMIAGLEQATQKTVMLTSASSGLGQTFSAMEPSISTSASSFDKLQLSIGLTMASAESAVTGGMSQITAAMANGMATAAIAAGLAFSGLNDTITGVMTRAQFAIASSMNSIVAAMANGAALATQSLANALAPIPGIVSGVGLRAAFAANAAGRGIANGFETGADDAPSKVAAALSGIPGIISGVGLRAAAAARAAGSNISSAFAAGIRSNLGEIQAAANAMVAAAEKAILAKAMISSPSKLFMQMGEYVGEGFTLGVRSMIPEAASASAALVSTATQGNIGVGGSFAGSPSGGSARVYNVTVNVQGDVTSENNLKVSIARAIWEADREEGIRQKQASGVI